MAEVGRAPVDIIWVVDNSSSMRPAIDELTRGINNFADQIARSGLDYRVIMIALRGPDGVDGRYPVCVAPPLAGDSRCGDGERFFQVSADIKSTQPFEQFLGTLGQTDGFMDGESRGGRPWRELLRDDATKTIVVVSDDDSRLSPSDFERFRGGSNPFNGTTLPPGILDASWGGLFDGYTFNGLYGWGDERNPDVTCEFRNPDDCVSEPCPASSGPNYTALVESTGGVRAKICDGAAAWTPFFNAVATTVEDTARVSCEIDLPAPPDGMTLDPNKVNVSLTSAGMATDLRKVPGGAAACGPAGGWYYDNDAAPTQVLLCPATCDVARGLFEREGDVDVEVAFGCDSVLI